jgi:hypothetical protein
MSFVVLFSTSSFSVDLHYCCDNLIDIGIFEQAEICSVKFQKSGMDSCEDSSESCCHNEKLYKSGHDDLKNSLTDYIIIDSMSYIETHIPYFDIFFELKKNPNTFNDYRPPLLFRNYTILLETFLI